MISSLREKIGSDPVNTGRTRHRRPKAASRRTKIASRNRIRAFEERITFANLSQRRRRRRPRAGFGTHGFLVLHRELFTEPFLTHPRHTDKSIVREKPYSCFCCQPAESSLSLILSCFPAAADPTSRIGDFEHRPSANLSSTKKRKVTSEVSGAAVC